MKSTYLYGVVFVAGAAVLAVEILGTRILGPFYGVSLFLWSALITVTLAALSLGYALGGRWADRGPRLGRLSSVVVVAGGWMLLVPWLRHPVLILTEPLGLRVAVLIAALILFAPPLMLLAMVSPYAIRLRATALQEVGRTAGNLYSISTIGSVVSALLTGFFLIPNFGVGRLTVAIGSTLVLVGSLGVIGGQPWKRRPVIALLALALAGGAAGVVPENTAQPQKGLVAVRQSPYGEVRVVDLGGRRHLLIDGGVHSVVRPSSWESYYPYVEVMNLPRELWDTPGKLLLIGLGGGSIAKNYAAAGWQVDAVEIDPVVTDMAYWYFGLESTEARIFTMDGRQFLARHPGIYDVIIMDAFGSSSIPFHLVTREAFSLVASRLGRAGVFAINLEARGWDDPMLDSIVATLRISFQHVIVLPTTGSAQELGNLVVLATNREKGMGLPSEALGRISSRLRRAWHNQFVPDGREAVVLTDDLNPVDLWAEAINLEARKDLHDYFGRSGLGW